MTDRTRQTNNTAGGDIAGRDVIKTVYNTPMPTALGQLIKKYKDESEEDHVLKEYIDDLILFAKPVPKDPLIGLENKLNAAGRDSEIYEALILKEIIYERLKANIGSPSFQQIYAYLLGDTKERFTTYVKPLINSGASNCEIDKAIFENVINPIRNDLEKCGEIHGFTLQSLKGLMYFLAGNCHIRWD